MHRSGYHRLLDLLADYITDGFAVSGADGQAPAVEHPAGRESALEEPAVGESASEELAAGERHGRRSAPEGPSAAESAAELPREERAALLAQLEAEVQGCTRCALHTGRTQAVPGVGALDPLVLVIGEGPGGEEDRQGEPFVGAAGRYLDKWLDAIGLSRKTNAYIANIVKCRPPGNRDPYPQERAACFPYLERQIRIIRPRTILTVGRISGRIVAGGMPNQSMRDLRGRVWDYQAIPVVATFHPSAVLRDPGLKRPVWEDLKRLRALFPESG